VQEEAADQTCKIDRRRSGANTLSEVSPEISLIVAELPPAVELDQAADQERLENEGKCALKDDLVIQASFVILHEDEEARTVNIFLQ
jgi:hypothetical protein